ncbi:viral A-type inclusion protein, partial [Reticulomyxa filosa]
KEWLSLTNKPQKLNTLICCICNQIANNAMELHCDEHENADQVYVVGEQCLQNYLKQNNGKCPIQQHQHCEFSQNKIVKKSVSKLLAICPRQFSLNKKQSNEGTKFGGDEEYWNESNLNLNLNSNSKKNCNCNYKGKMKDLKDHLDKSCNFISIKQNISYETVNELNVMSGQIKELQNAVKSQTEQVENLKTESLKKDEQIFGLTKDIQQFKIEIVNLKKQQNEQNKQIDNLKYELQEKGQIITALTNSIQQLKTDNTEFKKQLKQYQIKFDQYKQNITKVENQNTNIQQLQLQIKTQSKEEQKNEQRTTRTRTRKTTTTTIVRICCHSFKVRI